MRLPGFGDLKSGAQTKGLFTTSTSINYNFECLPVFRPISLVPFQFTFVQKVLGRLSSGSGFSRNRFGSDYDCNQPCRLTPCLSFNKRFELLSPSLMVRRRPAEELQQEPQREPQQEQDQELPPRQYYAPNPPPDVFKILADYHNEVFRIIRWLLVVLLLLVILFVIFILAQNWMDRKNK